MSQNRQSVIVLGAGPAGLTAAYRLNLLGLHVSVLDQSPNLEYHLRRESDSPLSIPGCFHATWSLLRCLQGKHDTLGFTEASLEFLLPNGRLSQYPRTRFPTPLSQLLTIGRFTGLPRQARWKLLSWLAQLWDGSLHLETDLEYRTAQEWLQSLEHSQSSLQTIWNPLACWLTGNDLRSISAQAFAATLKQFFLSDAKSGRIYVPRHPWQQIFVQPIADTLIKSGGRLVLGNKAVGIDHKDERITGVRLKDGAVLQADWYVSAVPHYELTPLLPERWLTRYAYFQQIAELTTVPWTVIQVRTAQTLTAPRHILMGTGAFVWMTCKPSESDQGMVAVLARSNQKSSNDRLEDLSNLLISLNLLQKNNEVTSFREQLSLHPPLALLPGTKIRRPIQRSPIPNLLLAGSWTDTGWPANLESAIVSGERCADIIRTHLPV
ncbi:hydroxysqualene dehydroxylase [Petrachloros mirabilis]